MQLLPDDIASETDATKMVDFINGRRDTKGLSERRSFEFRAAHSLITRTKKLRATPLSEERFARALEKEFRKKRLLLG